MLLLYVHILSAKLTNVIDRICYCCLVDVLCRHGVVSGVDASDWVESIRVRYYSPRTVIVNKNIQHNK